MDENTPMVALLREFRDQIVSELRTEIRTGLADTNERVDRLTERVDTMNATLIRHEVMFQQMDVRLDGIGGRLDGIDGRLDGIDGRLDGIDNRLDGIDGRLDGTNGRLDRLETTVKEQQTVIVRLAEGEAKNHEAIKALARVCKRIEKRIDYVYTGPINATLRDHEARLRILEEREP